MPAKIQKVLASGARTFYQCLPPPPLLKLIGKLVILSESSWSSIPAYTQARRVLVRKSATKAIITFLSETFFTKKVVGGGRVCQKNTALGPPKNMGPTTPLLCYPFQLCLKNTTEIYDDILILSRFYQQIGNDITVAMSFWNNLSLNFIG